MISVIIPTYKNRDTLLRNLNKNLLFLRECEVIIINDDPEESLRRELAAYRGVVLVENDVNLGFGSSVNKGVKVAKGRYVVLLNSDAILKKDHLEKLTAYFERDNDLFGIGFAQKERDGRTVGNNRFFWKNGFFMHSGNPTVKRGSTGWIEGGACIVDKQKYDELGGFDPIYNPFYWEDIDLSYRAWKRGYHVLFEPGIVVDHHHESTIGRYFSRSFVKMIAYRNQFFFIWKNITDGKLMTDHLISLPFFLVSLVFKGEFQGVVGFMRAVLKLGEILEKRNKQRKSYRKSDSEVFQNFL